MYVLLLFLFVLLYYLENSLYDYTVWYVVGFYLIEICVLIIYRLYTFKEFGSIVIWD